MIQEKKEQYQWLRDLGYGKYRAIWMTLFSINASVLFHYTRRIDNAEKGDSAGN